MVEKRILDTDILTHYFRNHATVLGHASRYLTYHATLSIGCITYYEVLRGLSYINASRQLHDLEQFARDNEIVPLDRVALERSAETYVQLRQQGQLINEADILIAGMALAQNAILVTNNTAHFSRIPDLVIENWLKP